MPFSQTLLPEFDEEMKNARKMLECVPDGKFDYQPHAKSMTLGRLASHVAEMPEWTVITLDTEVLDMSPDTKPVIASSRAELLARFDKGMKEARARIAAASDETWNVDWTFKYDGKAILSMPRSAVMRSMILNHLIHHRAQLGVYLRLNDIAIPGMYGPSADEEKFTQTSAAA
jgi:uncharacterized damage-inducible protein DinB